MGGQAEPFLLTHLHRINEQGFQQGNIQLEEHVHNVASHQHLDNIWMKENWRNLGDVEKLLEERGKK